MLLLLALAILLSTIYLILSLMRVSGKITFLLAGYLIGNALIVLFVEGLSLFQAITLKNLLWINLPLLISLFVLTILKKPTLFNPFKFIKSSLRSLFFGRVDLILFVSIIIFGFILYGAVNWFFWVSEHDSVVYHIPRIIYWMQHKSLMPWEESVLNPRVAYPVNAEIVELWVSIFWGTDRLISFVPWFAGIMSVFSVYGLARQLKISRQSSLFISLAFVSIPVAAWQTKLILSHDLITVVFIISSIYFLFRWKTFNKFGDIFLSGIGLGLALGTKYIAFFVLPGYLIILFVIIKNKWESYPFRNILVSTVLFLFPTILLAGYIYFQNLIFFGGFLGKPGGLDAATTFDFSSYKGILYSLNCFKLNVFRNLYYLFIAGKSGLQLQIGNIASDIFASTNLESDLCVDIISFTFVPTYLPIERGVGLQSMLLILPGSIYWVFKNRFFLQKEMSYLFLIAISFLFSHSLAMIWSPQARRYYLVFFALLLPLCVSFYEKFLHGKLMRYLSVVGCLASMFITHILYEVDHLVPNGNTFGIPDRYSYEMKEESLAPAAFYADQLIPESDSVGIIFNREYVFYDYPLWGEHFSRYLDRGVCQQPYAEKIILKELPFLYVGLECQDWLSGKLEVENLDYIFVFELGSVALYQRAGTAQSGFTIATPQKFPAKKPYIEVVSQSSRINDRLEIVPVVNRVVRENGKMIKLPDGGIKDFEVLQIQNGSSLHFQLVAEEPLDSVRAVLITESSSLELESQIELVVLDRDYSEIARSLGQWDEEKKQYVFNIRLTEGDNHLLLKLSSQNHNRLILSKLEIIVN